MRTSNNRSSGNYPSSNQNKHQDIYEQETKEVSVPRDEYEDTEGQEYSYEENQEEYEDLNSGEDNYQEGPSIQEEIIHRRNVMAYNQIEEQIIQGNLMDDMPPVNEQDTLGVSLDDGYTYEEDMSQYEKQGLSTKAKVGIICGAVAVVVLGSFLFLRMLAKPDKEPIEDLESSSLVSTIPDGFYSEDVSNIKKSIDALYTDSHKIDTVEGTSQGSIDNIATQISALEVKVADTDEYDESIDSLRKELNTLNSYINDKRILTDLQKSDISLAGSDFSSYLVSIKSSTEAYTIEGLRATNNTKITTLQGFLTEYNKLKEELKLSNIQDIENFDETVYVQRISGIPYTVNQDELNQMLEVIKLTRDAKKAEKEAADKNKSDEEKNAAQKVIEDLNKKIDELKGEITQMQSTPTPAPTPDNTPSEGSEGDNQGDNNGSGDNAGQQFMDWIGGMINQAGNTEG